MKWSIIIASMLIVARGAPVAEPEAFLDLGAVAIPAITGSALIDGILLGKVAFLKAAILANLLLDQGETESTGYGAPEAAYGAPVDSYGAPAVAYEEPAPSYEEPAPSYQEPAAPSYQEPAPAPAYAPVQDSYGSPAAQPVDTYGSPSADPLPSYNGY